MRGIPARCRIFLLCFGSDVNDPPPTNARQAAFSGNFNWLWYKLGFCQKLVLDNFSTKKSAKYIGRKRLRRESALVAKAGRSFSLSLSLSLSLHRLRFMVSLSQAPGRSDVGAFFHFCAESKQKTHSNPDSRSFP